jgi:type I restriction enzyme S subunit
MSFPRYESYKDSGVEWLGAIPVGWDIWKLSHFAPIITCGVAATPEYENEGVIFLSAQNVKNGKIDLSPGYKYISGKKHSELTKNRTPSKGDILISRVGTIGEACIVDVDFEFSIFVSLTHLRLAQQICLNKFFTYILRSKYVKCLNEAITLVGGGVGNLNVNDLREYKLALPSISEQSKIVSFLDRETAKIDALIAEQQRLIELLKEKRQALISHAVTKGLNPDAPMKESGIEWLGEVPKHWKLKQLKHVVDPTTSITYGIVQAGPHYEGGIPYIKTSDISGDSLPLEGYSLTSPEIDYAYQRSKVTKGDLVIAIRATVGKCLPVPDELDGANLTQGTAKISPGLNVSKEYLLSAINASATQAYFDHMAKGATFKEITLDALRRTPVVLPPIGEQIVISDYLKQEITKLDTLTTEAKTAINLLQERRTALISAAVTGKIDVRGLVSAALPEEAAA